MAWCCQVTNNYLSTCWPSFISPYGVTMRLDNLKKVWSFFVIDHVSCGITYDRNENGCVWTINTWNPYNNLHIEKLASFGSLKMSYLISEFKSSCCEFCRKDDVIPPLWRFYFYFFISNIFIQGITNQLQTVLSWSPVLKNFVYLQYACKTIVFTPTWYIQQFDKIISIT